MNEAALRSGVVLGQHVTGRHQHPRVTVWTPLAQRQHPVHGQTTAAVVTAAALLGSCAARRSTAVMLMTALATPVSVMSTCR